MFVFFSLHDGCLFRLDFRLLFKILGLKNTPRLELMPWHLVPYKASTPSFERPKSVSTACASSSRTTFLSARGTWGKLRTAFRLEENSSQEQYWENDNLRYQTHSREKPTLKYCICISDWQKGKNTHNYVTLLDYWSVVLKEIWRKIDVMTFLSCCFRWAQAAIDCQWVGAVLLVGWWIYRPRLANSPY